MNFSPLSIFKRRLGATLQPGVTLTAKEPDAPKMSVVTPDADTLMTTISSLTAERDQANAAFAEITAAMQTLAADHSAAIAARDKAITERDAAQAIAAKTREEITTEIRNAELAALAASQGIPATEIVPASGPGEQTEEQKIQALSEKLAACTSPTERFEISKQVRALISKTKTK